MYLRELMATEIDDFKACITEYPDLTSVRVYTICFNSIVVGYIAYDRWDTLSACICYLHVKPEYRCKGYGKAALKALVNRLTSSCRYVYGFAEDHVIDWYRKMGCPILAEGEVMYYHEDEGIYIK